MSKGILVMEDMPERCYHCLFCTEDDECLALEVTSIDVNVLQDKPDWCPLVPLPERQKPLNKKGYRSGYIEGWNDAIDAIERGNNPHNQ